MPQTFSRILLHIVFSTKQRQPFLKSDIRERVFSYFGGIVNGKYGHLVKVNGVEDHVHLLVDLKTTIRVCDLLRDLKSDSSSWIHEKLPELREFSWQRGYGAFSVGESQRQHVVRYIERQQHHHQKHSFEDELRELLNRYGLEYDERYWLD